MSLSQGSLALPFLVLVWSWQGAWQGNQDTNRFLIHACGAGGRHALISPSPAASRPFLWPCNTPRIFTAAAACWSTAATGTTTAADAHVHAAPTAAAADAPTTTAADAHGMFMQHPQQQLRMVWHRGWPRIPCGRASGLQWLLCLLQMQGCFRIFGDAHESSGTRSTSLAAPLSGNSSSFFRYHEISGCWGAGCLCTAHEAQAGDRTHMPYEKVLISA